ncbi:MAG: AbrB/MazE/SpoVT family DNA-binding domain-containing protein [Cetobacterium sp.]
MEVRDLNIIFNKSGTGSTSTRLSIPIKWLRQMDISQDERGVTVYFDGEKIIITKENLYE